MRREIFLGGIIFCETAAEISTVSPLGVEPSDLVSPNHLAVLSPRPENGTYRESMSRRVSASKGGRDDEAMPPCVKPKAGHKTATVCYSNPCSVDSLSVNDIDDKVKGV